MSSLGSYDRSVESLFGSGTYSFGKMDEVQPQPVSLLQLQACRLPDEQGCRDEGKSQRKCLHANHHHKLEHD